jgi:hypothetical protein
MHIFAFKGPNKPGPVHKPESAIAGICKSITIKPSGNEQNPERALLVDPPAEPGPV